MKTIVYLILICTSIAVAQEIHYSAKAANQQDRALHCKFQNFISNNIVTSEDLDKESNAYMQTAINGYAGNTNKFETQLERQQKAHSNYVAVAKSIMTNAPAK